VLNIREKIASLEYLTRLTTILAPFNWWHTGAFAGLLPCSALVCAAWHFGACETLGMYHTGALITMPACVVSLASLGLYTGSDDPERFSANGYI